MIYWFFVVLLLVVFVNSQHLPPKEKFDEIFGWLSNGAGCQVTTVLNHKISARYGYGFCEWEHGIGYTGDSVFRLASVSKQFAAFSIALLIHDGKIKLNQKVTDFFPQFKNVKGGSDLEIYHLVHMISGIKDVLSMTTLSDMSLGTNYDESVMLEIILRQPDLDFMPGDKFVYSNSNYLLLQKIVSMVSKKSFKDFTKERIFEPLNMNSTRWYESHNFGSPLVPKMCPSYGAKGGLEGKIPIEMFLNGAAGLFSTSDDLLKWDANFYDNKLGYGADLIETVYTTAKLNSGDEIPYAFGLIVVNSTLGKGVLHDGSLPGIHTAIWRYPDVKFSAIVLCNGETVEPKLDEMITELGKAYFQSETHPKRFSIGGMISSLPSEISWQSQSKLKVEKMLQERKEFLHRKQNNIDLKDFVGIYQSEDIMTFYNVYLNKDSGRLRVDFKHIFIPSVEFDVKADDTFTWIGTPIFGNFIRDSNGKVTKMILSEVRATNIVFNKVEKAPKCYNY